MLEGVWRKKTWRGASGRVLKGQKPWWKRVGFSRSPGLQRIQEGNQDIVRDLVTLLHVPGIASGKVCGTQGAGHTCLIKRNEFPD